MGTNSYVVRGKGNPESFESCSHGAGRSHSRKKAVEKFSVQDVIEDMKKRGVILLKTNKSTVAEECPWSYKDVDKVIENQKDLIEVVDILKPIGVLMS
jgi:tRNA-splicing ligase RtcB